MTLSHLLTQAIRMTLRDWRAGELRLLAGALVIAVAAVTSVGFFVDRIRLGLERDARQLLGADLVVSADAPLAPELRQGAGLQFTDTVTFPSMAINAGNAELTTLAAVKAVGDGYPLRGTLRTRTTIEGADAPAGGIPPRGVLWADPQAFQALRVAPGGEVKLGDLVFRAERVITVEPDRGTQFINFAPRVMINAADLAATGLIQPGSRVTYRLLVAGDTLAAVRAYQQRITPLLKRGQEVDTLEGGRPEMQRTMERAERFLSLVALLAAMVAAVAVAASARRFSLRHLDSCAMMRCLGLAQR
ncbi:MAG: ABC transporter permease, partial [Burkholderiaceae bacterium]|nr:ABC transporter permease [Burkholderiaceae bacterium]